jgi:hypothetical protein
MRLFQARDFEGAQAHFERSLAIDGSSTDTRFWLARTLQARWRASQEPERAELAAQCLAEFEKVLEKQPDRSEAYQALIGVARETDDATAVPVLERLAGDERLPAARRADALLALAAHGRACAEERLQTIAEQPVLSGPRLRATGTRRGREGAGARSRTGEPLARARDPLCEPRPGGGPRRS